MTRNFLIMLLLSGAAFAQGGLYTDIALNSSGRPAAGASVRICGASATGTPCSPAATIYTSTTLATTASNPITADASGNFSFYAPFGVYKRQITVSGSTYTDLVFVAGPATINARTGGARCNGSTDDSGNFQAALASAVAANFAAVDFPAGTCYLANGIGWSPYVQAVSAGEVILTTDLASGNFITISDLYGKPSPDPNSTGLTRSKTFTGQFLLKNTNAANTTLALFVGGATVANYASQMAIDGMGITGFKGGVIQFGYNSPLNNFSNFFAVNNTTGPQISVLAGATNTGEKETFEDCTFGGAGGSPAGMLFSINSNLAMSFNLHHCSLDYLSGLNDATKTAPLTHVTIDGGSWLEWDQVAAAYVNLNNGISFVLSDDVFTSPLTVGFSTPFVGNVTGTASSLKVTNPHFIFAPGITTLFTGSSASSRIDLDPHPNYQGGSAPTNYVCYAADCNPRITILDNGNIGIHNAAPTQTLDVSGSISASIQFIGDNFVSRNGDMNFDSGSITRSIIFKVNSVEKGRFNTSGNFALTGGLIVGASGSTIADSRELLQSVHLCGSTVTCANTANGSYREVIGTVALTSASPSTATITGISPAFTSTSTYFCTMTPEGATAAIAAGGVALTKVSGSSFTITGPNTVTTVIDFDCKGN